MRYILAIDQSTSATKAVLFDSAGCAVDRESREHRQIYPQPGWVEHDAEEIWENLVAVVCELARRNEKKVAAAIGLAIANQRETFVIFERGTGRPLHNAIVWQCRRSDSICQDLGTETCLKLVRRKTGLKLDAYFSGSKLKWLLDSRPDILRSLQCGEALVGTMDTYLLYRLTNCKVFACDSTNASRTLLYDIGRLGWDEELCNLFDVPIRALAEVRESFDTFGNTNVRGTLPRELPICGVMGDSQASMFAQCCFDKGTAKATLGSGTSVLLNTGEQFEVSDRGTVSALAWVWKHRPVYALEGIIKYSSATIAWLKDQLGLIVDVNETDPLARAVEDNAGVYLVPAFAGLSAPFWSHDARAAILGMTTYTTKEHVVRAALEAIAYQIRDVLEMMRSESGVAPGVLCVDGGPTRNQFLMQFTADITGLQLIVSDVAETSARGAAMAAMLGLGEVDTLSDLTNLRGNVRTYTPQMEKVQVEKLVSGWHQALRRVV